jgi:tetratricopeptide (TPR) repeat protein
VSKESEVDRRFTEALRLLEDGDAEGALAIGIELEAMRHSSGFEVQALARSSMDDVSAAIETLERGVENAPSAWPLWQLLGNSYSGEQRYEDAIRSYRRALECPQVDTLSVHYNLATILARQGRYADALSHLDLAHLGDENDPKLSLLVASSRIDALARIGRLDEALREARRIITKARLENALDDLIAPVFGSYASALWIGLGDRAAAQEAAWEAIGLDKTESGAMWTLRELNSEASSEGSLYRVMIAGTWHEPLEEGGEMPGFFTTSWAIADSPEEAFAMVSRFEPIEVRDSLQIEECEALERRPGEPKGVYSTSGYSSFIETDPDE